MQLNITKLAPLMESARASFWFVPSQMILLTVLLTLGTVYFDAVYIPKHQLSWPLLFGADVDAMRSLLGTIAASMITVTSIAFSITIVALTLASSQFGPRLLRNFMMDRGTQIVLGAFISNFLFCILVFCAISFQKPYDFTPSLSVATAIFMTFVSVAILIYFIHHVAKSIQADVVIDQVYRELQTNINNLFPSHQQPSNPDVQAFCETAEQAHEFQHKVLSNSDGYVQTLDIEQLVCLATQHGWLIKCFYSPGDFIVKGTVVAHINANASIPAELADKVLQQMSLGAYRTPVQDPEFAIHQLVEIALRALSPGINDPYTAITCVDKLSAVLCELTNKTFPAKVHFDDQGIFRLESKQLSFTSIAEAAFDQIRQQAKLNLAVSIRLLESLHRLSGCAQTESQCEFVLQQTQMIEQQQNTHDLAKGDLQEINSRVSKIKKVLKA
ncbi:DUF2254 domain-containing protein [Paraglaciecola aquimarina]|uniref:DUF2254 domain-containing protein n=1 Tax=Paraglaciecola aquimarina TaxID=1235557 RepID=A0ABU3SSN0_9ALTE|nr:DUF2254 domain-containing protein [Paraglaciecola aquimarina]MDU0352977.1 DUF2254 domain-containing protein [Paraglaciecola aquimarina]